MSESLDYFLPYQQRWLNSPAPFVVGEKSRRIGWTYATSYRDVERRVKGDCNLYYSSSDQEGAKEYIDYCTMWAGIFNVVATMTEEILPIDDKEMLTYVLTFANGRKIVAGSSNPKFFRGKGGDVDLDEYALHADPVKLLKAAHATALFWSYQLRIWSTHLGEGNYFNYLVKQGKSFMAAREAGPAALASYKGMKLEVQSVTVLDAVEQGIVEKIRQQKEKLKFTPAPDERLRQEWLDDLRSTVPDEDTWNEEYMCKPSSDQASLLSYPLLRTCEVANLQLLNIDQLDPTKTYHAGFDIGRKKDLSALWVLEKVGDVFWTRVLRTLERVDFTSQEGVLNTLMANRGVKRICIDSTGIGAMLAERASQRWGKYRAEEVNFSAPVKSELAMPLLRLFQDKLVRIPEADVVREDLHKIRKIVTAANNVRLDADRDEDGHADRFWALALAYHSADALKLPLPPPRLVKPLGW